MTDAKNAFESGTGVNQLSLSRPSQETVATDPSVERRVADLRQANEKLVIASLEANMREERAAEAHTKQSQFLSMLAHELRNPLAPIAMSVELLGKITSAAPEVLTLQRILARQTAHLTRLVDDLMDATRIESGKINIQRSAVLLSRLIAQAIEVSESARLANKQSLRLALPHSPVWIHGDFVRLTQLLANLLINASKFSANLSPIDIAAWLDGNNVIISVTDQGIGITSEQLPSVFDLFTQGPTAPGNLTSGLGIGLSLAQTIAHLHGGHVTVTSDGAGRGSEFRVTLPVEVHVDATKDIWTDGMDGRDSLKSVDNANQVDSLGIAASTAQDSHPKHILLIDDNEDINNTLRQFLELAGHRVDCALDGATGLHMQNLHRYDVICCDIGLPGMSGYQVAEALRERQATARLIAISGYGQPHQIDRARRAGFDNYLVKPIFGEELSELLAHVDK